MEEAGGERRDLSPGVALLLESAAVQMGAGSGRWRIDFTLDDGFLRSWHRQEEGGRDALHRFDTAIEGGT